jgi:glucose-1-phosphate thymidylyltransferase
VKGIILAGGAGTRLYPLTKVISKQLLPVFNKPMIYYPLATLMLAGIHEIMIITTPRDSLTFKRLFNDIYAKCGLIIRWIEQSKPEGIAQALILAEPYLDGGSSCLILGDNLFFGSGMTGLTENCTSLFKGAIVFGYHVSNPQDYGVIEIDNDGHILSIEEKPKEPKSNIAVPGIYFFDGSAPEKARTLKKSARGESEIIDLIKKYMDEDRLRLEIMPRGIAWLDTGSYESLLEASNFIATIEHRQGLKVADLEEIARLKQFI